MKSLQEYLTEAIADGRFKVSPIVNKIIKKPVVDSICKDITTKLEAFGFKDFSIEPDKKWKVFDIEESEPTGGRYIVLPLNSNAGDGDIYMAEYNSEAIQQFDKTFGTKETGRFVLYDVTDVTNEFNLPEHIHVYAQNHVGSSRGVKFNNPNFVLAIPVNEIPELWNEYNGQTT